MSAKPESHTHMSASHPAELSLDQCIKCNICTTVCPVSGVTDLFPGPKYEAPQAGRFRRITGNRHRITPWITAAVAGLATWSAQPG